ncbi:MAG: radical SAM protein [Acidaminococcales bacterium]|jgi:radical SAM protein with 4Fe4S-binding SPASM domain|nr:radical SAM protein [Acidaminococcales bacterium]
MLENIHQVFVKLGDNCNYSCAYCCQRKGGKRPAPASAPIYISPEVFSFLADMAAKAPEPLTVRPFGGEPLLYMDAIKQLISALSAHKDKIRWFINTNGSLLTEEIVDYFNQNCVVAYISNDGPHTDQTRTSNVLTDERLLALFRRLEHKAINGVLSAHNQDLYAFWDWCESKFGKDVETGIEILMPDPVMPPDLYAFDLPAFKSTMQRLVAEAVEAYKAGKTGKADRVSWFVMSFALGVLNAALSGNKSRTSFACGQLTERLTVDVAGRVIFCQNFGASIGHVTDKDIDEKIEAAWEKAVKLLKRCEKCEIFIYCRGQCPFLAESPGKEMMCKVRKILFGGVLDYINALTEGEIR